MHAYAYRLSESEKGSVRHEFLIYDDQTGTASSSPDILTPSPTIINVMLWMRKNAYEGTTIKQIRLYDFRHFKATMEYHKTKDLLT
jgi:integrase